MSGKKISEMTAITGGQLDQVNDVVPILDVSDTSNPNKKISIQELASVIGASGTTNVSLALDGSNNLTLTDSDSNTVTVDLSSLDNSGLTLADVTANGQTTDQDLLLNSTGHLQLPVGTVAERSGTPANGMIRYNSDDDVFEGYDGEWGSFVIEGNAQTVINNLKIQNSGSSILIGNATAALSTKYAIKQSAAGDTVLNSNDKIQIAKGAVVYSEIQQNSHFTIPQGTTAERPTAAAGMIRFNTTTSKFEGYDGTSWIDLN